MPKRAESGEVIEKAIASKYLKDQRSYHLNKFTAIDSDAAQVLSRYNGDLELNGLISMPEGVALALSKHRGGRLSLNGLRGLSAEAYDCLKKHGKITTAKSLESLVYTSNIKLLRSALDELASCGIVVRKAIFRNLKKWPYEPDRFYGGYGSVFFEVLSMLASQDLASSEKLPIGSRGFNLDYECIYETGDYSSIVEQLVFITGQSDRLSNLLDHVDLPKKEVWIQFEFAGKRYKLTPEINNDWACDKTIKRIARIIKPSDCCFYKLNDGQSDNIFCFTRDIEKELLKRKRRFDYDDFRKL
jgi:hypothetical protein